MIVGGHYWLFHTTVKCVKVWVAVSAAVYASALHHQPPPDSAVIRCYRLPGWPAPLVEHERPPIELPPGVAMPLPPWNGEASSPMLMAGGEEWPGAPLYPGPFIGAPLGPVVIGGPAGGGISPGPGVGGVIPAIPEFPAVPAGPIAPSVPASPPLPASPIPAPTPSAPVPEPASLAVLAIGIAGLCLARRQRS